MDFWPEHQQSMAQVWKHRLLRARLSRFSYLQSRTCQGAVLPQAASVISGVGRNENERGHNGAATRKWSSGVSGTK